MSLLAPWQAELSRQIEALGDSDWDRELIPVGKRGRLVRSKTFKIPLGHLGPERAHEVLMPLVGSVNGWPCAGVEPGCLKFDGFDEDRTVAWDGEKVDIAYAATGHFTIRDRSWDLGEAERADFGVIP